MHPTSMKLAILSDIHGNWEAFSAVLELLDKEKVDKIIILGDIVGYGADPNLCVKKAKEVAEVNLMGNHDAAVAGLTSLEEFNPFAKEACIWTSKVLDSENLDFLRKLPYTHKEENILYVHSAPSDPTRWKYILDVWDADWEFRTFDEQICFFGHTHQAIAYRESDNKVGVIESYTFEIVPGARYMINPGSVGQPRDYDPRAAFVLMEDGVVRILRVMYDVKKAATKILEAGLPPILAERLYQGL